MAKKKSAPAIYPAPEPIKVQKPLQAVAIDLEKGVIGVGTPPEMKAAVELEKWRVDLNARIATYTRACAIRFSPHFGQRPDYIPANDWQDLEKRIRALRELPSEAPAEAVDAFRALKLIMRLADDIATEGGVSEHIERALCIALDAGMLLQRSQVQVDYGDIVDRGKRNVAATRSGNAVKSARTSKKMKLARAEYDRLRDRKRPPSKTRTLKIMADKKRPDGKREYAALRTLITWAKDWP